MLRIDDAASIRWIEGGICEEIGRQIVTLRRVSSQGSTKEGIMSDMRATRRRTEARRAGTGPEAQP